MNLLSKLGLCWRILMAYPSNLMEHADRELPRAEDKWQLYMNQQLKELVLVFSTHHHSGMSAGYAISLLEKLLRLQPLRPLTGESDEWMEVSDGIRQNLRCSHVFRDDKKFGGKAYDINGRVFREPSGLTFTSADSYTPVTFPYTPKIEYVDVPEPGSTQYVDMQQ